MKDSWLNDDVVHDVSGTHLIDFVLQLREILRVSTDLVDANAMVAQSISISWYDKHAKMVTSEEGELVLLLLPLIGKPLQAKY